MNDKYSLAKCAHYGRRLAARLCDHHFASQPDARLDGPALRQFAPLRQVNLLVIRQLLTEWQNENHRLRSPYFDFEADEVQAALTQFMNLLSRHISLARPAFEPLLAQAIADTLALAAAPATAFERLFLPSDPHTPITATALRTALRYIDTDKAFYEGFLDVLPTDELTRTSLLERLALYRTANYKAHQPVQRLVSELSALLPLTTADLLEDGPVATSAPASASPPSASVAPAQPAPLPSAAPAAFAPATPTEPAMPTPAEPVPANAVLTAPAAVPPAPPVPAAGPNANPAAPALPLHEKLKATQTHAPGLAETLRATTSHAPTLTDRTAPKVETLREAISINQRFSFINELFGGETLEYHAAIQHLDSLPTADQARAYILENLSPRHNWAQKDEHVARLLKLLDRKFS